MNSTTTDNYLNPVTMRATRRQHGRGRYWLWAMMAAVALLLAGCGGDSSSNDAAQSSSPTTSPTTTTGTLSLLAGNPGGPGSADGTGTEASFSFPGGIAVDASGTVYVADTYNNTIRKITPNGSGSLVSTLVGVAGVSGVALGDLPGSLSAPLGVAMNAAGELLITSSNAVLIASKPGGF